MPNILVQQAKELVFKWIKKEVLEKIASEWKFLGSGPAGWLIGILVNWGLKLFAKYSEIFIREFELNIKIFLDRKGVEEDFGKMHDAITKGDKEGEKKYDRKLRSHYDSLFNFNR